MKNRFLKIIVSIIVGYALLGFLIIPAVVQWQLPKNMNNLLQGTTTLESAYFNPFTFKFKLIGLKIAKEDKELISFKELYIDFSLLKSLHNTHIAFKNIELAGLVVNVVQNKAGEINLLSLLKENNNNKTEEATLEQTSEQKSVIPFKIGKTILSDASINLQLENGDEPIHANLKNLNYTFYDLGTYKRSLASHSLSTTLNKETTVTIDGGFYLIPFNMYGKVAITNLHTNDYVPYKKELLNFTPLDAQLDLHFGYQINLNKTLEAKIENLDLQLRNLDLQQKQKTFASLKAFEILNANIYYPEQKVQINSINLQQPFAHAIIDKKGTLNFANLVVQKPVSANTQSIPEQNISTTSQEANQTKPWSVAINDVNINNAKVQFDDIKNRLYLKTNNLNVNINDNKLLNQDLTSSGVKVGFEQLNLLDKNNNLNVLLKQYLLQLSNVSKKEETIAVDKINLSQQYASIDNKATNIIAKKIELQVDDVLTKGNYIKIKQSLLNQPQLVITVKKVPIAKNSATVQKATSKNKNSTTKSEPAMNLDFGPFNINKANIVFEDKNLPIPFKTTISKLNGNFSELITKSSKPTKLKLEGQVDRYGYTKITGFVDHKNIKNLTDIEMLFKNIAIKNFTPYSGKFVGRELDAGKLNLNLKYNITKSNIDAKNSIVITDIKLGKQVQSPDAMSLPLELAIALMEDTNGVIDLNIPIAGNVDDPQFSIAPIVWKAFTNLIVKAITSPFRFLASLFDFDEEELKSLEFTFGQTQLIASEKETLDNIAQIFAKRPKIALKIQPTYHLQNDTLALQTQKLETKIDATVKTIKKGEDKYLMALEQTYASIKEAKPLKEVKKQSLDKDGKFDRYAYADTLKKFLILQEKVSQKELETLTKTRINSIVNYFKTAHKIESDRLIINQEFKDKPESKEWTQFDLEIGLKQ